VLQGMVPGDAAKLVAAMDLHEGSMAAILGMMSADQGTGILMDLPFDRRVAVAQVLAPADAAKFIAGLPAEEAAALLRGLDLEAAQAILLDMNVAERARLLQHWDESFTVEVNAAVSRRLMSKVVKAIYLPPGNWGKAAIKVHRIVRLKRKMAKLMEKMTDILKEFKSYSKPNRTVIAVSAALGLLTEGAPQVLEHLGEDYSVPTSLSELQLLWSTTKGLVQISGNRPGTREYMQELQVKLLNGTCGEQVCVVQTEVASLLCVCVCVLYL
jgi:hypothetical protein